MTPLGRHVPLCCCSSFTFFPRFSSFLAHNTKTRSTGVWVVVAFVVAEANIYIYIYIYMLNKDESFPCFCREWKKKKEEKERKKRKVIFFEKVKHEGYFLRLDVCVFHEFLWFSMDFHGGNTFWTVLDHFDHGGPHGPMGPWLHHTLYIGSHTMDPWIHGAHHDQNDPKPSEK